MRLDVALVSLGIAKSRTYAQDIIAAGKVTIDGSIATKSSQIISIDAKIEADTEDWVSRGGKKLNLFLSEIDLEIKDKLCLDVGASTGGFTQALLKHNAKHVVAVDVGTSQLHYTLKDNPQVTSIENIDIRNYTNDPFDIVVCDLAFISVHQVIDKLKELAKNDIIILFKPQFEVGKEIKRTRNGVVNNHGAIMDAKHLFEDAMHKKALNIKYSAQSKISGKEGNNEFFYHITKQ